MKRIVSLALAMAMIAGLAAQNLKETTAEIGDLTVPAYSLTIQKDKKLVQAALDQRLKDAKLKMKKSEGFQASLGKIFRDISDQPVNFYCKVEGSKDEATVTMCAMSTNLSVNQSMVNMSVSRFLQNFEGYAARYAAAEQLKVEQENLKKAQRELSSAQAAVKNIDKKTEGNRKKLKSRQDEMAKCQKRIKECEKDIENLQSTIDKDSGKNREEAQQKVKEAEQQVKKAQAEVERYRQMSK